MQDGLPQKICYECLSRIELFHSYKQSCLESQHTLKHWNSFCEGGSLPLDVDIFSGRSTSTNEMSEGDLLNAIMAKRVSTENMMTQQIKSTGSPPSRPPSRLGLPVINTTSIATPPRRISMDTALAQEIFQISPDSRKSNFPVSGILTKQNSDSEQNLHPAASLRVTLKQVNPTCNTESSKEVTEKSEVEAKNSVQVKNRSSSFTSSRTRSQMPEKEIALRSREISQLPKRSIESKTESEGKRQMPVRNQNIAKKNTEKKNSKSQSPDKSKSSEKIVTKSPPMLPTIKIVNIQSLAAKSFDSQGHALENGLTKPKIRSTVSTPVKSVTCTKTQISETAVKYFAPTISEVVKQRKRSNSVSSAGNSSAKKSRKVNLSPAVDTNKENSVTNLKACMSDKADEILNTSKDKNGSDATNMEKDDDSTQALLRLLESDDVEDNDFSQSDGENVSSDNSGAGSPASKNPLNPYVKVEKLAGEKDSSSTETKDEVNAVNATTTRVRRRRQQSNQYR
ncbi:hypothetical protein L9F63_014368, partial [Diploptera punctata]